MARGHHYRPAEAHMGDHAMRADGGGVAARARGGKAREEGEKEDGKMESYTAKPNEVEEEAEGEERKHGGRAKRALGGAAPRARGGRSPEHETKTEEEHEEEKKKREHRARGGALKHVGMEGEKTKHRRLDRPGRKRGGGIGADMSPLSTAARVKEAGDHKADNDEIGES